MSNKAKKLRLLLNEMTLGIVRFTYQKENGEIRQAFGTLNRNIYIHYIDSRPWSRNHVQAYFDMQTMDFRCFSVANLLEVYTDDNPLDLMFI